MPRKRIGPEPMTAAKRKQEQRLRDRTTIMESPDTEWSERQCLMVLQGRYADVLQRGAWEQLGRLRGWHS